MLKRLKYSVTFAQTGRTLEADIQFPSGYCAITGPNEAGKSMIFEMARYLLFGTDALRGPADDYKTLKVSGEFIIRDNVVEIDRTIKTATVKRNGQVIATGTKAANAKLVEELGFGMGVFDIANAINQGEVEQLGKMRPMQRKAMIDSVLGLSMLDNVAKWAAEEARLLDKQAESIRGRLLPPGVPPVEPAGYRPSAELGVELGSLREQTHELAEINGFLAVERTKPVKPTCKVDLPAVNLQQFADKRRALRETVADLNARVRALPTAAPYTEAQLDSFEAQWGQYERHREASIWLVQHPRPKWASVTQLQVFQDDWTALKNINARAALAVRIDGLKAKGSKPCPHCGEDIPLEQDTIERLQAEHDALPVPNNGKAPPTPPIAEAAIPAAIRELQTFDEVKHTEMSAVPMVDRPHVDQGEMLRCRTALLQVAERAELEPQLSAARKQFDAMPDYETMLAERTAYEAALTTYHAEAQTFETWYRERQIKTMRRDQLKDAPAEYARLSELNTWCVAYENDLARHTEMEAAYRAGEAAAIEAEAEAAEHRKVREVMAVLRGLIKQHVLPSLNKVASHLLRQMTGGQRNLIVIDDEFNVRVDQQSLETLSGSGKACANLAIRVALGQVLTNRVLSILLADEIDASMDAFRAEKTSNVLQTLEQSISQVLLVSHKPVEAPHHIRLGDISGDEFDGADLDREAA